MNRHQFTQQTRDAFNAAVALDIIDAVELGCMMNEFNGNAEDIINDITEAAYTHIHGDRSKHEKWCAIADQWFATRKPDTFATYAKMFQA
jgi:hypothetical protein